MQPGSGQPKLSADMPPDAAMLPGWACKEETEDEWH